MAIAGFDGFARPGMGERQAGRSNPPPRQMRLDLGIAAIVEPFTVDPVRGRTPTFTCFGSRGVSESTSEYRQHVVSSACFDLCL